MNIENIIAGCNVDKAEYLHKIIRKELEKTKVISITRKNGETIKHIKSVASWGEGFYYGIRRNQKNFTKSFSVFNIAKINDKELNNGFSI